MRVTIIQFSPSGNTLKVSEAIKSELEKKGDMSVQILDITGDKEFFNAESRAEFLKNNVETHDVLLIGCPVYTNHLQYHVQDLIKMLPKPDSGIWGNTAIPFVTYGGISSGIALEEAGVLLKKSGRTVIGGMKIVASHKMTRAFMDTEFNAGKPDDGMTPIINELIKKIHRVKKGEALTDQSKHLKYQSRLYAFKVNVIFNEKKWHNERFPKVFIEKENCENCGKCTTVCPVLHLQENSDNTITENKGSDCIHCFSCVAGCPAKAIRLKGNLEKGRSFMANLIEKKGNREYPGSYFYA